MQEHGLHPRKPALLGSGIPSLRHILLDRNKSLSSAGTLWEGTIQGPGSQEEATTGAILENGKRTELFFVSFVVSCLEVD